jgi:two-component system nitrogen regulation response regulator GlnG
MPMIDHDFTLTSPLSTLETLDDRLLALTIVWHPDVARIGEQYVGGGFAGGIELNRYAPEFSRPGAPGLPLGHGAISRERLLIVRNRAGGIAIKVPASRMVVELNGQVVGGEQHLSPADLEQGQILGLGRTVLICLHWMHCLPRENAVPGLVGVGAAAIALRDQIRQVAPTALPVLLLGETGTGKEIAARAIHALSPRAKAPLVTVNMAALNESLAAADLFGAAKGAYTGAQAARAGLFAEAENASLFLDEIGNTPASVQPMLLRVLEGGDYRPLGAAADRQSNARLIAATDQDLGSTGFNPALLRRLENFVIHLPPLRARREDIGVLLVHLLALESSEDGARVELPFSVASALACHDWPGNIRQLANVLRRIRLALLAGETPPLPTLLGDVPPRDSVRSAQEPVVEKNAGAPPKRRGKPGELSEDDVLAAMEDNGWNILAAAQALAISRPTMYKLLESHRQIRRAELIPAEEIGQAFAASAGNIQRCASLLKTPSEALRRRVNLLGLG